MISSGTSLVFYARCTLLYSSTFLLSLSVPMRECLGKHWCMSYIFPIAILNGTCFYAKRNSNFFSSCFAYQNLTVITLDLSSEHFITDEGVLRSKNSFSAVFIFNSHLHLFIMFVHTSGRGVVASTVHHSGRTAWLPTQFTPVDEQCGCQHSSPQWTNVWLSTQFTPVDENCGCLDSSLQWTKQSICLHSSPQWTNTVITSTHPSGRTI